MKAKNIQPYLVLFHKLLIDSPLPPSPETREREEKCWLWKEWSLLTGEALMCGWLLWIPFCFSFFFFHFILSLQQKAIHWEKNLKQSLESDCNGSSVVHTYWLKSVHWVMMQESKMLYIFSLRRFSYPLKFLCFSREWIIIWSQDLLYLLHSLVKKIILCGLCWAS